MSASLYFRGNWSNPDLPPAPWGAHALPILQCPPLETPPHRHRRLPIGKSPAPDLQNIGQNPAPCVPARLIHEKSIGGNPRQFRKSSFPPRPVRAYPACRRFFFRPAANQQVFLHMPTQNPPKHPAPRRPSQKLSRFASGACSMRVASAGPANRHSREEKSSDPNVRRYLPSP